MFIDIVLKIVIALIAFGVFAGVGYLTIRQGKAVKSQTDVEEHGVRATAKVISRDTVIHSDKGDRSYRYSYVVELTLETGETVQIAREDPVSVFFQPNETCDVIYNPADIPRFKFVKEMSGASIDANVFFVIGGISYLVGVVFALLVIF